MSREIQTGDLLSAAFYSMNILSFHHLVGTKWVPQWLNELRDTSPLHLEGEDGTCTETDITNPHFSESPLNLIPL